MATKKTLAIGTLGLATAILGWYLLERQPSPSPDNTSNNSVVQRQQIEYRNIGFLALDLEKQAGFEVSNEEYNMLSSLIQQAGEKIQISKNPDKTEAVRSLSAINNLIREFGFQYKKNNLLSNGIRRREIDCLDASLFYLAIGEEYGLPLSLVLGPKHAFVRCQLPDGTYFNWECTNGEELSDAEYTSWLKIHQRSLSTGAYLRTLSRTELIGSILDTIALVKSHQEDPTSAIAYHNRAISSNPRLPEAYNNRGLDKRDLGDNQSALADFDKALDLNPNYTHAYRDRGRAKFELGDSHGAITDYTRAIELDPSFKEAYNDRGISKSKIGDIEGSISDFTKAIEIDPNYKFAYNNRGLRRLGQQQLEQAIADFNLAINIDGNYANAHHNRGVAFERLGRKEEAKKDFERAKKLGHE